MTTSLHEGKEFENLLAAIAEVARLRAALQRIADGETFPQMLAKGVLLPARQRPE